MARRIHTKSPLMLDIRCVCVAYYAYPHRQERTVFMSNYVKLATDAADQYLAALAESQEQFLKYAKTAAAWTPAVAPMPGLAPDYLPTPREISEANFAFA